MFSRLLLAALARAVLSEEYYYDSNETMAPTTEAIAAAPTATTATAAPTVTSATAAPTATTATAAPTATSAMSAPTATDAAAPTKGDPFEDTDDTCVDDATFVDAQGLTCADHERWDCEAYASKYAALYDESEAADIADACPRACGSCSSACPSGRTSYEAATYDELAAVVAADVCADVTITASLVLDSEIELSNNKSDVVLRGAAGVELSGNNGTTRVLSSAGSLTLRDLVITEGAAAGGGSYYDYFDDGDYSIDGGGVYFCGEKLRVWGCDIVGNAAGVSAFWAYYQYNAEGGEGGGLFVCPNSEEVVLGDTTVRSNVAPGDGGGLFVEQPDTLTLRPGTSFDGNKAAGAGGAIYASNYGLVYAGDGVREAARAAAVTFSNNVAMEGDGGAIFATACRVELSSFVATDNGASGSGGFLYHSPNPTLCPSDFPYLTGDAVGTYLADATFANNNAFGDGGVVYAYMSDEIDETMDVSMSSAVSDASSGATGGFLFAQNANVSLHAVTAVNSAATEGGGCLSLTSCAATATDLVVENATAVEGFGGGAALTSTSLFVSGASVTGCAASSGGAMALASASANLTRAVLDANVADQGGALYLDAASAVKLAESSATGNDGAFEGGFAFIRDGVVDGSGTTAVVGSTSAAGAHVYVSDYGEATIQGLTLADGATTYGGALYCTVGSDCRVRDVASVGNQVTSEGALAYVERTALLTLRNVSSAKDGASVGIVSVGADAVLDAVDLRVSDSMVDAEGISASKPHSVFLANSTFDRCFAYDYAAVLYASGGAVSLVDVDILGTYTQWDAGAIELQVAALAANRTTVSGGVGGPALLLKSGVATITDATFSSNDCTYGAGVVQTSEGARVVFRNTAFLNNTAEDAAALAATDFSVVNATDCVFAGNAAVFGSGGAASVATSSSLATSRTSFLRNDAAVDAGAVLVAPPAEFVSLGNTTLAGNVAATGDGGAVKISGDDDAIAGVVVLDAAGDLVAANRAPLGGGGAAYYSPGASPEPRVGRARANEALFGDILATPVKSLAFVDSRSSGRLAYAVESGVEVNGSIEVELLDLYGQRVRTSEGDAVILSTDDAGATLTGDISTEVFAGLATFGGVTITKVPGSIVALEATISAAGLVADASVNLTDCVAGEYYNSGVCTTCPRGKVSFEPTDSCHTCPDDATCSGGHALVPDDGYWRSTSLSLNVLKCASDDYCPDSSVDLWNKLNPTSWRAPTASCAYNHAGPRCALCKRDYYLDAETFRCVACEGGGEDTQKLLLFIFAFFAGLVIVVAVGYYAVKHWLGAYVDAMQKTDVFASLNDKWLPFLVPKLKILLVTVQIVGAFGETFSAVDFPDIFAKLTESLSIFGFDPSAFFSASTECDRPQWDFLSKLVMYTVLPIVGLALLFGAYELLRRRHPKSREIFMLFGLLGTHMLYTTVSNVIFASLFCDDDYDDEPDGSPFKNGSWLAADYTVSCRSDRYKSHAIYAYICIVIYPVGIPLGFFALLYSVRDSIAPTDYDAFVSKILSGEDRTLALEEPVEVAETDTAEEKAVKRKYSLVPASPAKKSVKASAERVLNAKRAAAEAGDGADHLVSSERFAKVLAVHHKAVEFLHVQEALANFPEESKDAALGVLTTVGQNMVIEHRSIDPACSHLTFLFDEYEPRCWWFECAECFRRICLTGFMVLYDDDSIGKLYTAALMSLFFTCIYVYYQPYVDDSTDRFSTVMSGMVFLQLFLTIMLYAETYIEDDHIRAGWSTKKFGEMMVGLAVASVPAQALIEFCLELEIDLISLIGLAFAALCCVTQAIRLRMSKGEGAAEEPAEAPADDGPEGASVISLVENAEASLKLERSQTRAPADVQSRCLDAPTNAAELPLCFGVDADAAI